MLREILGSETFDYPSSYGPSAMIITYKKRHALQKRDQQQQRLKKKAELRSPHFPWHLQHIPDIQVFNIQDVHVFVLKNVGRPLFDLLLCLFQSSFFK